MGEAKAKEFFEGMRANGVKMLSSNGEVKRRVAAGEFAFGLTDTDDASVAMKEGKPVTMVYPDQDAAGSLIVPNAAVLIANGPDPEHGKQFIEYLLSAAVEQSLAKSEAAQMPLRPGVPVPPGVKRVEEIKAMPVDYEKLGARLQELSAGYLRTWAASQ
jgi:iron(III) transport system substrate-binding protein